MKSEILDSPLPQDLDAEVRMLAACLRYPKTLVRIDLQSKEFYSPLHAAIWDGFHAIHERREPIDEDTTRRMCAELQLRADSVAEAIARGSELLGIEFYVPHYAGRVRETFQRRMIRHAAEDMLRESSDEKLPVEEILAACEDKLSKIATGKFSTEPVELSESIRLAIDEIDQIVTRTKRAGCLTGFLSFDEKIGGLFAGELSILAARPGIGKTSLALQIAHHAAAKGRRVYFASLEMSHVELATKLLCSESGVSNQRVRNADLTPIDQNLLVDAGCQMASLPVRIHDWSSIRVYDIRRAARAMKAELVIVDYLQLVTPSEHNAKRYEQVAQLAKDLKAMARELDVPVMALAQLNRDIDQQGKDRRPRLSHLRESGDIEQTADMVLLLSRPKGGYSTAKKDGEAGCRWDAELDVAKNRKGATPMLRFFWDEERTLYRDEERF